MEWIDYCKISSIKTVDDFPELLNVINTPELTEFQYVVEGDKWIATIK